MFRIFYWSFELVFPAVTTSYRVDIFEIVKRLKEAKLVLLWKKDSFSFFWLIWVSGKHHFVEAWKYSRLNKFQASLALIFAYLWA